MKKPRIYILVKNFSGVNQDVELLKNMKEAEIAFEKYTGFPFNTQYNNPESDLYNEKFSETKIYELDLPDFLELRRRNSNLKR
ncbi:MAG: hypothetical protein ACETWM_17355 [Candidatus Lokiarchaeia archaeon]